MTYDCRGEDYGVFVNQKMCGKFIIEWKNNGNRYEGGMNENKQHGEGLMTYGEENEENKNFKSI